MLTKFQDVMIEDVLNHIKSIFK